MRDVFIIGTGQTAVSKDSGARGRQLGAAAIRAAIEDARIDKEQVDALFVGNMTSGILGRQQQLGSLIADYAGLGGVEATSIEAACASGAAAARMGYVTIAGGIHDIAIICGVERMSHADRDTVTQALATAADWELEGRRGETFPSLNAQLMRAYMQRYDSRPEDFAPFSITAHENAMTNENALFHRRVTVEDYLESRIIADPIRLLDVSPICDGAAAVVLASADAAPALQGPRVRIAGSASATAPLALSRRSDVLDLDAVAASTRAALSMAGIGRSDVDLFELHDAYTIMSALTLESAGFAAPGTATRLAAEGRFGLSGELPISTMGGLKARGHPVGATGVYQLVEGYLQLTGRAGRNQVSDAACAFIQNIGGTASTVVNHVLQRIG